MEIKAGDKLRHKVTGEELVARGGPFSNGKGRPAQVRVQRPDGSISNPALTSVELIDSAERRATPSRVEMLEQEVKELRSRESKDRAGAVHAERIARAIESNTPKARIARVRPSAVSGPRRHVHNLLLSDIHYGEHVEAEQVNGMNHYDIEVCKDRMRQVVQSVVSFKDNRPYPIDKLVISALGDNCSGGPGIHDEIRESNVLTVSEQAHDVGMLLGATVEELLGYYREVELVGVSGNHPRMARPHASKNVFDNFDWIGYKTAQVYLTRYEQATVIAQRSAMTIHEIAGQNVLLWHGDGVRSSMPGVPWGGVMRRWNELKRQHANTGTILSCLQVGHYHQPNIVQGGEILMNGSIVGINEYGLKNFGSGSPPCQLLVTWDATGGRQTDVSYITPR